VFDPQYSCADISHPFRVNSGLKVAHECISPEGAAEIAQGVEAELTALGKACRWYLSPEGAQEGRLNKFRVCEQGASELAGQALSIRKL
jgi:hypothetical protein